MTEEIKKRRGRPPKVKEPSPDDILAKIAHAQSQVAANTLPPEGEIKGDGQLEAEQIKYSAPMVQPAVISAEPGENDPDYEARMIEKIERAMAQSRQQTLDSLKPPQIKIVPLSVNTSEVQIIGNREIEIEDTEKDTRPEFVQKDDENL